MLLHRGGRRRAPDRRRRRRGSGTRSGTPASCSGQSVRTVKEALAVADDDLDALTALLDVRLVAGDRGRWSTTSSRRVRRARAAPPDRLRRRAASAAAAERLDRPGPIAEMLEPDLKNGGGGLRDVQTPGWAAWALPAGGDRRPTCSTAGVGRRRRACWSSAGYLQPRRSRPAARRPPRAPRRARRAPPGHGRPIRPAAAAGAGRGRPAASGRPTPTMLVRGLGEAARAVVWITRDLWSRLLGGRGGPERSRGRRAATSATASCWRDGRIALRPRRDDRHRHRRCVRRCTRRALGVPFERDSARPGSTELTVDHVGRRRPRRIHRPAGRRARRDPGVRDPRPRRAARAGCSPSGRRVRARPAAQRVPPLHRRPALARSGRRVRGAARPERPGARTSTARWRARARGATCCCSPRCCTTSPRDGPATTRSWGSRSRARRRRSHRHRRVR